MKKLLILLFLCFYNFPLHAQVKKFNTNKDELLYSMVTLATFKCFAVRDFEGNPPVSVKEFTSNYLNKQRVNLSFLSLPQVKKVSSSLATKYKNNCEGIYQETEYNINKLLSKYKGKKVNKSSLIKPECSLDPEKSNIKKVFACEICKDAYKENLKRRTTVLSGDFSGRDYWVSRWLELYKAIISKNPNFVPQEVKDNLYKESSKAADQTIIEAKSLCPSLY